MSLIAYIGNVRHCDRERIPSESQFTQLLPIRREATMRDFKTGRVLVDRGVSAVSGGPGGRGSTKAKEDRGKSP
jgi:hypothetical protein